MGNHILQMFDSELAEIRSTLITLGNHVKDELNLALAVLLDNKELDLEIIYSLDREANLLRDKVLHLTAKTLLRQHAVADDLRFILAASRIANSIERIGDYAKNTVKRSHILEKPIVEAIEISFADMAKLTTNGLEQAIRAYVEQDFELAKATWHSDDEINSTYNDLFDLIIEKMEADHRRIKDYAHLLFIAKGLERVGDLVSDICQETHFMLTAELIKK